MRGSPIPVSVSPRGTGLPGQGPAFFPKKAGRKKGPGECPRHPPKNGGSWRRCAVRTGQKPGAYRRPFSRRFPYRRCRAPGNTHRDYPANPESCCAVPAWPAGPPSVPCLRNTEPVTEVGAPTATQRSGRRGERRPGGGNELSRLRGSERSAAWADDVGAHLCVRPHVRGRQYGRRPLSDTAYTLTHKGATS